MPDNSLIAVGARTLKRAALVGGLAMTSLTLVSPVAAQDIVGDGSPEGTAPIRVCGAAWAPGTAGAGEDSARSVHALCWGTWLALGSAEAFRYAFNFDLEATVVELTRGGEPAVLLIRPDGEGRPFIENLGSVLADAAGRTRLGNLEGLAFDYDGFAFTGQIGITPEAASLADAEGAFTTAEAQAVPASPASVAIGAHIAADDARLASAGAE